MNKWLGTLRTTGDIDVRYSNSASGSMAIASFSGAVNRRFKREGEADADFFNFVAFGKTAENLEKLQVKKGTKLLIEAEVRNNNYEKDGVKHYSTQFVVNSFEFCESKKEEQPQPTPSSVGDGFMNIPEGIEDELPFN